MSRPTLPNSVLADRVRSAMTTSKHSQYDVAAHTGLSIITVYNLLNDRCGKLRKSTRSRLHSYVSYYSKKPQKTWPSFAWLKLSFTK